MSLYEKLRYELVPTAFPIFFTVIALLLPHYGRDEEITIFGLLSTLFGNKVSWAFVSLVFIWAWLWLIVPSKTYNGPVTTDGATPIYKGRGVVYYWISVTIYLLCEIKWPGMSSLIYNSTPSIICSLNIIALPLCTYFYLKPSQLSQLPERNYPGPYIFYRGKEIHLKVLGVDAKQLIISRIGLMLWQILIIAYFIASFDLYGYNFPHLISLLLQSIYLCKFYYWEKGYYYTLDVTLDRIGYYLVWGCLVWVPGFYTLTSYYLASHTPVISNTAAFFIGLFGIISIIMNYWVDLQKLRFRSCPDGKCVISGNPAKFIRGKYKDNNGKERTSLLLISGLWGVARHLNYTFEIASSIFWCLPGLWLGVQPLLYIPYIIILLLHRIFRDEEKCRHKYGKVWASYCDQVPYRLIPKIF